MLNLRFIVPALLLTFLSVSVQGADLITDPSDPNILIGITGLNVDGEYFDVSFEVGTFNEVYGTATPVDDPPLYFEEDSSGATEATIELGELLNATIGTPMEITSIVGLDTAVIPYWSELQNNYESNALIYNEGHDSVNSFWSYDGWAWGPRDEDFEPPRAYGIVTPSQVPEPTSLTILLGLATCCFAGTARRRRRC